MDKLFEKGFDLLHKYFSTTVIVFIAAAVLILLFTVLQKLLPPFILWLIKSLRTNFSQKRNDSFSDKKIRNFASNTANKNWVLSIRSLTKVNLNIGLTEIFHPPLFSKSSQSENAIVKLDDILFNHESIVITGGPGSGKSSIINYLAHLYSKDEIEMRLGIKDVRLPILIHLRNINSFDYPLTNLIVDYYKSKSCVFDEKFVEKRLNQKQCVIFFDGLDEVTNPKLRKDVKEWILNCIANYPGNRFIVSCRDIDWTSLKIPNLEEFRIADLDADQSSKIVSLWRPKLAPLQQENLDASFKKIQMDNSTWILENPLRLTIFILLTTLNIEIPKSKSNLYKVFLRVLLKEWAETKDNYANIIDPDQVWLLLQSLSLFLLKDRSQSELIDLTEENTNRFLEAQLIFSDGNDSNRYKELFTALSSTAILRPVSDSIFEFTNRGFLEYLSACELARIKGDNEVLDNYNKDFWNETIILYFELTKHSASFKHFISDSKESKAYYRLLSEIALSNSIPSESFKLVKDKIFKYLPKMYEDESVDQIFINNAFKLDREALFKFVEFEIKNLNNSLIADKILSSFVTINDSDIIEALPLLFNKVSEDQKKIIVYQLRFNAYSDNFLWDLGQDARFRKLAIDTLSNKGINVYNRAKEIITSKVENSSEDLRTLAIDVLLKFQKVETLIFLTKFTTMLNSWELNYIDTVTNGAIRKLSGSKILIKPETRFWKRVIDIIGSIILLILLLPISLPIILLIKLESKGPAFYKTRRYSRSRTLQVAKFRSMVRDYDNDSLQRIVNDPRLTKTGTFLRKTSLDQIPYLFSVLKGDISLVGPRLLPEYIIGHSKELSFTYEKIYESFKPGIFGWALLNGLRGELQTKDSIEEGLQADWWYVCNHTLLLDFKIFSYSIFRSISGDKNAY